MSTVKQFHEEEAIGKTYDLQVARRLLRYLKPYVRLLVGALALTLALNLLGCCSQSLRSTQSTGTSCRARLMG